MPNETTEFKENKTNDKSKRAGASGTAAAGMQSSGEGIFLPESDQPKVTLESDVFGQQNTDSKTGQTNQNAQTAQKSNDQNDAGAKQASQQVGQVLSGDLKPVTDALNEAKNVAGAFAGQAYEEVQHKAGSVISEQKQSLADGLGSVAQNIRQFGENLRGGDQKQPNQIAATAAQYGETLAEQIESLSGYLERGDFRTFGRDLQSFARRNPTIFVAGAFGLGLLAARFIKSSPRPVNNRANDGNRSGRARQPRASQASENISSRVDSTTVDDRASTLTSLPPTV